MAKAKVGAQKTISLQLDLTEEEAQTLMGMLQNPIGDVHPDDEDEVSSSVRFTIFDALHAHFYDDKRPGTPISGFPGLSIIS